MAHGQRKAEKTYSMDSAEFSEMVLRIPFSAFNEAVRRSGMPDKEARELCLAFKALKA